MTHTTQRYHHAYISFPGLRAQEAFRLLIFNYIACLSIGLLKLLIHTNSPVVWTHKKKCLLFTFAHTHTHKMSSLLFDVRACCSWIENETQTHRQTNTKRNKFFFSYVSICFQFKPNFCLAFISRMNCAKKDWTNPEPMNRKKKQKKTKKKKKKKSNSPTATTFDAIQ